MGPRSARRIQWGRFGSTHRMQSGGCCGCPTSWGLGAAYVSGDIEVDGNVFDVVTAFRDSKPEGVETTVCLEGASHRGRAAKRIGALGGPLAPPPEEARASRLASFAAA